MLVNEAQLAGFEAYHVAHLGKSAFRDWDLVVHAIAQDLVFVTNNAADFRALYAREELHPGLVIIVPNVDRKTQITLFRLALARLVQIPDLVNKVLELRFGSNGADLELYDWPSF